MKQGLLSQDVLLPGEDEAALKELGDLLRDELQPVGELESLFVDRITAAYWRLRRLGQVEAGMFAWELYGEMADQARKEADTYTSILGEVLVAMDTDIVDKNKHQKALTRAQEMETMQHAKTSTLSRTFIRDAN
jgi:hypothetical protein